MEIIAGEYVRTTTGEIAKIERCYGKDRYYKNQEHYEMDVMVTKFNNFILYEENIKAHSFNIIDILEPGDYINGIKVDYVFPPLKIFADAEEYLEDEIKTIVTKEQFKGMEYKV